MCVCVCNVPAILGKDSWWEIGCVAASGVLFFTPVLLLVVHRLTDTNGHMMGLTCDVISLKLCDNAFVCFQTHMQRLFWAENSGVDLTDLLQPKCNKNTVWIKAIMPPVSVKQTHFLCPLCMYLSSLVNPDSFLHLRERMNLEGRSRQRYTAARTESHCTGEQVISLILHVVFHSV